MLKTFASIRRRKINKFLIATILVWFTFCFSWIFALYMEISLSSIFSYGTVSLTVTLRSGRIKGTYKKSYNDRQFLAFEGIPYAAPPIGKLRFQSPKKVLKWKGTLLTNKTYTCIQMVNKKEVIGDENCLFLNVYVPKVDTTQKLPVVVNFHSGNFMTGSPKFSGPTKFMDRNVVFVTVNYRLGILGFFSSFDDVIPGNFGLKDQSYALKWVQKNIEKFGGNKKLVTIIGMSAGGASVHYHYFSTLSKGLFHRGISQSGTAIDPWALKLNEVNIFKKIRRKVGCRPRKLLSCMQKVSAKKLVTQTAKFFQQYQHLPMAPLGPVVEAYHKDAFITIDPYDLLTAKEFQDVPYLITTTTQEGIFPSVYYLNDLDELNKKWRKMSSLFFDYYNLYNRRETLEISENVTETFFQNRNITKDNFKRFVDVISERLWDLGAEKSAKLHAMGGKSNVYLMKIGYGGEKLRWDEVAKRNLSLGVGHLEDSKFYYDGTHLDFRFSEKEEQMKDVLIDIVTDFATFGKMRVRNWKRINPKGDTVEYLRLNGPTRLFINKARNRTSADKFWSNVRKILEKHCYS